MADNPANLTPAVVQSVADANFKSIAEANAIAMNQAIQNAVAHQQAMNAIAQATTTMCVNKLLNIDPAEAKSLTEAMTGNKGADAISALGTAVAGLQQMLKGAQSTPPVT